MDISEDEFKKLTVKSQNLVIFKNVNMVANSMRGMKFHQKVQYVVLGGVIVMVGFIAETLLKHIVGK